MDKKMKSYLKAFVEEHPDGWNHDEWLRLLAALDGAGVNMGAPDEVGVELERTRLDWELDRRSVPGLGPKRRAALVDRFVSLGQLRSASAEDVAGVPSITKALADKVVAAIH